jgi:hypothetical protein
MKLFLLTLLSVVLLPRSQAEGPAEVHHYASGPPGIFANAYARRFRSSPPRAWTR